MILFSDGAPLTPAGGSSWSLVQQTKQTAISDHADFNIRDITP